MTDKVDQDIVDAANEIFLPDNYDIPSTSRYMKFEQGENKFRVLASPIIGNEGWKTADDGSKKPVRKRMGEPFESDDEVDSLEEVRHFWAMLVWNYKAQAIQILEITQKTILRTITALAKDSEWGSPLGYDLSVVREGEGMKTEYNVIPSPHKPLTAEIQEAWNAEKDKIDLGKLFTGENPFML